MILLFLIAQGVDNRKLLSPAPKKTGGYMGIGDLLTSRVLPIEEGEGTITAVQLHGLGPRADDMNADVAKR